ncbi:hypothetical protein PHYBLDRAFT_165783 [Phycomyces blakesleeanus NRRL 1555(-)]|uniref:Uncharacterized protein n=2 Tax=Phycomyces blakesleeanus TaxID=4837 RepID=A0A167NFW3_PHYB8|nr:hypothetical protein PHYBLDRAFT_165783 [Phycomyces blakesleeanus NRRL 1555(-)]OAD75799.1 hypothetical protein PHYBLDRAFT_165783 [Phycomyces blakesleeanus NRRL 1555(-)]|eukprot:XP_018293839.1 hypothetical protein PHYBLDRAFT_165783 [Phycomyces blakesleeanus NRRL 1555(-)]
MTLPMSEHPIFSPNTTNMIYHKKSASCTAIPSYTELHSRTTSMTSMSGSGAVSSEITQRPPKLEHHPNQNLSTSTSSSQTPRNNASSQSTSAEQNSSFSKDVVKSELSSMLIQSNMFSLPTVCIFSQSALANEYSNETEIAPFVYPVTTSLEHITMLIGMLQSLLRVVDETSTGEEEEEDEEEEDQDDEGSGEWDSEDTMLDEKSEDNVSDTGNFAILGLGAFKVSLWNKMCDHILDGIVYKDDLCLVIIMSPRFSDRMITKHMQLLKKSLSESQLIKRSFSTDKVGEHLVSLAHYWFDQPDDDDKDI